MERKKLTLSTGKAISDRQKRQIRYYENKIKAQRAKAREMLKTGLESYRKYADDDKALIFMPRNYARPTFKNTQQVTAYIQKLKRETAPRADTRRANDYRQNYLKAIGKAFGRAAQNKVKALLPSGKAFQDLVLKSRDKLNIGYVYWDVGTDMNDDARLKLNKIINFIKTGNDSDYE